MNRFVYFLVFSFLIISCDQHSPQVERDYIKNLEEKNRILEKELQELKSKNEPSKVPPTNGKSKNLQNYFTIGSTIDEVLEIMGDPTTYTDLGSSGKRFHYGMSTIFFEDGKVESYDNVLGNLRVRVKGN